MSNENSNESKVISLFERAPKEPKSETEKDTDELSFEEIMKRNFENKERMKKDRLKSNKGVIRSYRLKK